MSEDVEVRGAAVDDETRCQHHAADEDVVAFRLPCCGDWWPCRECHDEAAEHAAETWGPGETDATAVLCGVCRSTMTIATYTACGHTCPDCGASFNPGCRHHWERYFALGR